MTKDLPLPNLDDFKIPQINNPEIRLGTGCAHSHDGAELSIEVLAVYDHDYVGVHSLIQVWDYNQQKSFDQRWQYILVLSCSENNWKPEIVAEWHERPSYVEVAKHVDLWCNIPTALKKLYL